MEQKTLAFAAGQVFESNTTYVGEKREYHIYPQNATGTINPWYSGGGAPVPVAFVLRGLENVTIDLGGAALIFHGRIAPFFLYGCKNVTIRNLTIDYERPFYTQGVVTDVDSDSMTLAIPEEFRYRVEGHSFIAMGEGWETSMVQHVLMQPYDTATLRLSRNCGMLLANIGEDAVTDPPSTALRNYKLLASQLPGNKVRFTGIPSFFTPKVGETIAFTHENRHKNGFEIENCEDTTIEDVRLLYVSAVALIANLCHNVTVRRFNSFYDELSRGRIISVNADILHGFHNTGKILVEDCRFENMLDDAFNFHGNYTVCQHAPDSHTIIAAHSGHGLCDIPIYMRGDMINVYRGSTQILKAVYTVEEAEYLPGELTTQKITVRESVKDFAAGDIIESTRMPEIEIRRCSSGHARGGYRFQSGKRIMVEDCHFENNTIMFTGDTNFWFENSPVRDATIRNCVFENYSGAAIIAEPIFTPTAEAPYFHKGIRIINNTFIDCRGGLMSMNRTDGVTFSGNTIIDCEKVSDKAHRIALTNCDNVTITGNREIINPELASDRVGIN